jgi:hypothetical protein
MTGYAYILSGKNKILFNTNASQEKNLFKADIYRIYPFRKAFKK